MTDRPSRFVPDSKMTGSGVAPRLLETDGAWRNFSIVLGQQIARGEIDIYGAAETITGARKMEITWTLDRNHARLTRWLVMEDDFAFPPVPRKDRSG
jgi:hypothetical protein